MRIILDQGIFDMRNMGQNALLQAAIERVQKLWPDASIGVTTFAPHWLKILFPDVFPVHPDGSPRWYKNRDIYNKIHHFIPSMIFMGFLEIREEIRHRRLGFALGSGRVILKSLIRSTSAGIKSADNLPVDTIHHTNVGEPNYSSVVSGADLFIATGSQYMCNHAGYAAFPVMGRLEASIQRGIPTAMVGQGIGPMDDLELRTRAKEILPLVDLILVRERLVAPGILASLGVNPARIMVTGDDAIELAYNARISALGSGIGVSMRCRPSTQVSDTDLTVIGEVLRATAQKYDAELVGLPISMSLHERDDLRTRQLMSGHNKVWMRRRKYQTPLAFIKDIQRCRLVITGTFHGAVLALAQGIPVICLVRSSLYTNKFNGLADLFGAGCEIISLEEEHFQERLIETIASNWRSAEKLRGSLLDAAKRQIEWGNSAYQCLFELVDSKRNSVK